MSKYYAVRVGRKVGIFRSWEETSKSVTGYASAKHKAFTTQSDALAFLALTNDPKALPVSEDEAKGLRKVIDVPRVVSSQKGLFLYTDGSHSESVGGFAWVSVEDGHLLGSGYGRVPYTPCTSQIAELYAIHEAIRVADDDATVRSDSIYAIGCLSKWNKEWKRNGWITTKGTAVENQELIKSILAIMRGKKITFEHVKGHSGDKYNTMVDEMANEGRKA